MLKTIRKNPPARTMHVRSLISAVSLVASVTSAWAQSPVASQQLIAPGSAVVNGGGSKAQLEAEKAARLEAAKYAWNKLRSKSAFSSDAMRFTLQQNAAMAAAVNELCNFTKLDEVKDKATKVLTVRYGIECPSQDITSKISEIKEEVEAARANDLDAREHDRLVYLFMSRRMTDMLNSSSNGSSYRASQKQYELVSSQALEDGLVNRISSVGLSAVSYSDLLVGGCSSLDPSAINREFSITPPGQSDYGLTTDTRSQIIAAVRKCGVKYLAIGAADVGATGRDPISGQPQGRVVVSALVLDIRQQLPVSLARVRTVADDIGGDETAAEENAMAKASADVGVKLVEQIRVKGVK